MTAHRPFYCPHCGYYDPLHTPETVIKREDLPLEFFENKKDSVCGYNLTIKCLACGQIYKAEEKHIAKGLDQKRIGELEDKIEMCEAEIDDLKGDLEDYRNELEDLKEAVAQPISVA